MYLLKMSYIRGGLSSQQSQNTGFTVYTIKRVKTGMYFTV